VVSAVAAALVGCSSPNDNATLASLERQVEEEEAAQRQWVEQGRELSQRRAEIRGRVLQLRSELEAAEAEFQRAREELEHASVMATEAAASYSHASEHFQRAARWYRHIARLLIVAAASDFIGAQLCGSTVSPRAFRARLEREGFAIPEGMDVDHIWPRALGGADHPANYQVLPSGVNRGLGASVSEKLLSAPMETLQGLGASALVALRCQPP
jgi:hypothetical protein